MVLAVDERASIAVTPVTICCVSFSWEDLLI